MSATLQRLNHLHPRRMSAALKGGCQERVHDIKRQPFLSIAEPCWVNCGRICVHWTREAVDSRSICGRTLGNFIGEYD